MTSRKAGPARLIRRQGNGQLFDTVENRPVTLDFVAGLVWLGENVCIFDERTREDRTEHVLAPAILSRLRRDVGSPLSVEGVALARAIKALVDVRADFERMHDQIAGLERLLQAAIHPSVDAASTGAGAGTSHGRVSSIDPIKRAKPGGAG